MNLTTLIPAPYRWLALALLAAALLAFGALQGARWQENRDAAELARVQGAWDEERAGLAIATQAQTVRNLDLQRAAEKNYVVKGEVRDRFIVTTVKEIRDDSAPLAACVVPESVRLRFNAAADCAGSDSSASCGAGDKVLTPR